MGVREVEVLDVEERLLALDMMCWGRVGQSVEPGSSLLRYSGRRRWKGLIEELWFLKSEW